MTATPVLVDGNVNGLSEPVQVEGSRVVIDILPVSVFRSSKIVIKASSVASSASQSSSRSEENAQLFNRLSWVGDIHAPGIYVVELIAGMYVALELQNANEDTSIYANIVS